ncbi:heat shock protein [Aureococcus anophagefferens]|uniref:Heat shock protein n=1 Tax=Aureococcus anophagefferens TaxID=44056 RepID=A0ABR1G8C1_AURAN
MLTRLKLKPLCDGSPLAAAHEVLSDDDRRRAYDATGADEPDAEAEARAAEQGPPEYTELPVKVEARFRPRAFRFSFAGTGVRAMSATRVPITVTMEDLLVGVTRNLTLSRRSFESLCGACGGFGKLRGPPCASCDGEGIAAETHVVTVVVPPGAPEGHEIVFRGLGDEHAHRDAGDLVVVVEAAPHGRFARSVDGANVWCNASVGLLDALYGFSKKLTGLDGARLDVRHDRVAFSSFTHELPGEGLPVFGNATQRGSLTVYVAVSFPRSLSALQLRVLRHIGLRPDELDFIRALQLLMAYQYATTVPDGSDELKFASRCYGDALDVCKPERRYWTWWRAVV